MSELILLRSFYHKHDAEIALGLLQDSGIEAVLSADDCGGFRQHLTLSMGNHRLLVKSADVEKAKEVLTVLDESLSDEEMKNLEKQALETTQEPPRPKIKFVRNFFIVLIVIFIGLFLWGLRSNF